jgi:hypothetical protein
LRITAGSVTVRRAPERQSLNQAEEIMAFGRRRQVYEKLLQLMDAVVSGISNHSDLLNRKFEQLLEGVGNQSDLINRRMEQLYNAINSQSDVLRQQIEQVQGNSGIQLRRNPPDLMDQRINQALEEMTRYNNLVEQKFEYIQKKFDIQFSMLNQKFDRLAEIASKQLE